VGCQAKIQPMKPKLEGGCACGAVRYRLGDAPMFVNCCHCTSCQRETGGAFVINAIIETSRVDLLEGRTEPVATPSESGRGQIIHRCPACHVALWSHYGGRTPVAFVRAGTLDDAAAIKPGAFIFTRSKLPWVTLPADIPAFEVYYEMETLWPPESRARRAAALAGG
jgi:hypothetical protein